MAKKAIGIFRILSLEDLDETARLFKKYSPEDVYNILNDKLFEKAKGTEGRRKLINNLMSVWGQGKSTPTDYQIEALEVYEDFSNEEKKVMHYLLTLIAFPFFTSTASLAGKYQRLTDTITSKTFTDEIYAEYGTSGTVVRSISNNLGLLREFGLLQQVKKGTYSFDVAKTAVNSVALKKLMIIATMRRAKTDIVTLDAVNEENMFYGLDYFIQKQDLSEDNFEIYVERTSTYIKLKQ